MMEQKLLGIWKKCSNGKEGERFAPITVDT